jgi:hypothetical protein
MAVCVPSEVLCQVGQGMMQLNVLLACVCVCVTGHVLLDSPCPALHGVCLWAQVRRVMIRRLKKDVLTQLPPKRRQVGPQGCVCGGGVILWTCPG